MYKLTYRWGHPLFIVAMLTFIAASIAPGRLHQFYNVPELQKEVSIPVIVAVWLLLSIGVAMSIKAARVQKIKIGITILSMMAILAALSNMFSTDPWWLMGEGMLRVNLIQLGAALVGGLVTSWALCNVQQEQSTVLREHGHRSAAGAEEPAAAAGAEPQAASPAPQAEVQEPLSPLTPSVQPAEEEEPGDTPKITRESRVPPTSTVTGLKAMSSGLGHSGLAARAAASGSSTNLKGLLDKLDPDVKLTIPPDSGADEAAPPAATPSPTPVSASGVAPLAEPISQSSSATASPTAEIVIPTPSDPTSTAANLPEQKKPPATTTATRLQAQKRKSTATFTKLQALSAGGGGGTSAPRPKQSENDNESDSLKSILDRLDTQPFDDEPLNDILSPVESLLTPPEVHEANRVAPPVAKQPDQPKPIEPPRTQIKPEFAKQAAKSQEPTKPAHPSKKEQSKTPEPGKKPEPAKPSGAKTETPKTPAKSEPVKADTQKPEPIKPTPAPSKAAHLPNDDETNLSAMLDNLESLLPESVSRETTDFSPPAASETPAASDSESDYNKDDLLAIPTPKAKPGLRELASKEANKPKPSLIKGKSADAAKSEATGDKGEKPEPEKSETTEAKAEPEKSEPAAEAKAEPEKSEPAAEAKAEPEKSEPAAEAKAEPEKSETAAEAKAEPEKSETTEAKAEPEKSETAAEAKAPEKSETTEAKAEPEKSEPAEAKAEPEKSETTEAKAEPEKSEAAEAKAEPEKSEAAEAKAEPEKSEAAEAKAEPENSETTESKTEPTSENPPEAMAAEEAKADPEKEEQKRETSEVSIGDAFAPEPASDEESALIAEAAGILANQEKVPDVSAETEAKAEPAESKTESDAPQTKAEATPEPAEAQSESVPESKADDKAPEAKSEATEQKLETPEQKAEAPEQKSEAPEQKAEAPEQKSEAPEQKAEAPEQKSEAPEQKAEAPEQKSEAPEQKAEAPEQKSEAPEQKAEAPEQKSEPVAETKPSAEEKLETSVAEIKPELSQEKAETESKPEPTDEPSKPLAEVAQLESEPKAETKAEPIPEPAEAATKAAPASQATPVEDNLFGAKVDQDIDDIFSAIAPPDAQKEVQAKLESATESQEKTISDSFIEIERSETVPDASDNVFGQAIDKDIDAIFDNIVPVEAQKEVKDTSYQKPYGADTQEKQETAQTKPAEPAAPAAESKPEPKPVLPPAAETKSTEPVAPAAESKPEPVTPKPVAATSAAEIAAALRAQSDTIPPVAPVEISGSSGLFEPQKIEKDLDDIFSNIAPEEAHQTVSDQTLAKLKQAEESEMSFEPPQSREERIAEAAKQPPPTVKFNETLARLPSMQGTVEGLLNNLADMADTDFKPGAKKPEEGPAPKSESDATQSKAVATNSVHDLLESLEQENKEHAAHASGESVPAKSEPEPAAPSTPKMQSESESESINAALEAAQNEQTARATAPPSTAEPSVASASTEVSSEDIMVKAEEEAAKQKAEADQQTEEGELQEGDVPLSMRSTVDIATALKDAQKAKQMAAVEKQLKEFGRLSTKAPTPSNEPPGSMKTIGKLLIEVSQIENIIKAGETGKIGSNLTTARVISAARGAGIKELLNKIDSYSGVKGSVIVGHDGLVIASTVGEDMDKDALGALSLHCLGSSNMATQKLEIGKLRQMVLISGEKITVLTDVDVGILAVFMDNTRVDRIDGLITAIHETIHG